MYEKLSQSRLQDKKEEKNLIVQTIHKCCMIENDEHLARIMKSIEPLLRNKMETEEATMKAMTSIEPKKQEATKEIGVVIHKIE